MLGICVGMQVLFDAGVEHGVRTDGLRRAARHGRAAASAEVLPHMGWNTVAPPDGLALFAGLDADARFYFVHSYALRCAHAPARDSGALITWPTHGEPFVAAVEDGAAVPRPSSTRRSPATRARVLLRNWLETIR